MEQIEGCISNITDKPFSFFLFLRQCLKHFEAKTGIYDQESWSVHNPWQMLVVFLLSFLLAPASLDPASSNILVG